MKKILALAALMLLAAPAAQAAGKWQLQLNAGVDILASGFGGTDSLGIGIGIGVGYAVNDNWSFWLNSNGYYRPTSFAGITEIFDEANLTAKYTFKSPSMSPYVRFGLGTFYDTASNGFITLSSSNLMLQGGAGLEFSAGKGMNFFVEADGGFVLATGTTGVTIPITAGIILDL